MFGLNYRDKTLSMTHMKETSPISDMRIANGLIVVQKVY
jgi:hypothetical protein